MSYDKPPRYDYDLTVNTLYDLRARARKHAEQSAARNLPTAPVSPISPLSSDGASTHTFNLDLASIWADDDARSLEAGPSTPYSARFPVAARRAPSPSASFLDDEEEEEPAPAYEDSQDDHSTWGPASTVRFSVATMQVEYAEQEETQEVLWDEAEDAWAAFEAICWAACDADPLPPPSPQRRRAPTITSPAPLPTQHQHYQHQPTQQHYQHQPTHYQHQHQPHHHPRASSLDTISTAARAPSPLVIAAPLPGLVSAFDEYGRASFDSATTASTTDSDGAGGLVYKSSFARTQPELALWRAPADGDTALVRPLDLDESYELGLPQRRLADRLGLDSASELGLEYEYADERPLQRGLTRLEYVRPRKPSPPRVDAQPVRKPRVSAWSPDTPAPSVGAWPPAAEARGGKGLRQLWRRATGKENAVAGLGAGRPVYAGF